MREERGNVRRADEERVVRLLCADLNNTVGAGFEAIVEESVARIRLFSDDPADFEQRVVDDVQQYLHDAFIDTSWPPCPDHPNHPLSYSAPTWACEQTGKVFGQLGTLTKTLKSPSDFG